ncbi:MAG: YesL family protein [Lachnospiraceae bacterium]|jgi:uncharacterized membrane protein YesL|nr:YesL family protein [Lachnospiraceae bacterium]
MNSLLNPEGKVMIFFTRIAYSAYLNVLWFFCCLPIVTAGASTTALFYVTLKMAKDEEGNVTKSFFRAFRQNFKKATVIWLILLALGIVLALDGYIFYHMRFENAFWAVGTAVFLVALAAYAIVMMYIFPLLARFENTVKAMFLNSIMLGMRFLLCTVAMAVIYFVMAFVIINVFTPIIIFGEGLCALLCSHLLSNIMLMCEEKAQKPEGDDMSADEEIPDAEKIPETQDAFETR